MPIEYTCAITGKVLEAKPNDSLLVPMNKSLRLRIIAETSTDNGQSFIRNYIGPDGEKELRKKLIPKNPKPK